MYISITNDKEYIHAHLSYVVTGLVFESNKSQVIAEKIIISEIDITLLICWLYLSAAINYKIAIEMIDTPNLLLILKLFLDKHSKMKHAYNNTAIEGVPAEIFVIA